MRSPSQNSPPPATTHVVRFSPKKVWCLDGKSSDSSIAGDFLPLRLSAENLSGYLEQAVWDKRFGEKRDTQTLCGLL